ncbi:MAG: UDP-glucose/GDP-mannose dehydrogenase family protein [Gemmatimonadales bacterium]|nr:UDP-glucose/GDP-mannose dehydrogenase family protein [Gemmatimonadales bacterium]
MRVAIIGAGYVGLVSGVCLAEQGHQVTCVDLDPAKVARINAGEPPIHENGLGELLRRHVGRGFRATTDLAAAVRGAELTMIAVGTPFDGHRIDLTAVTAASREIGAALRGVDAYHVVVVKSTVVPGTTETTVRRGVEEGSGKVAGQGFGLGMNPEFLTEGQAVEDFLHPDRIVLGGIDERTLNRMAELYQGFAGVPVVRTNPRTAEMIKYASNAMLATAISFSNDLAGLCTLLGEIDIAEVMQGVHLSAYLSPALEDGTRIRAPLASFYDAGCGFGGSCLPKDVKALVAQGAELGHPLRVLQAVLDVNRDQSHEVLRLLRKHHPTLRDLRVTVLGLAFKPDTDDVRESPGLRIVELLLDEGARVTGYDPAARPALNGRHPATALTLAPDLAVAIGGAEAIVIATRWDEFRRLPRLLDGVVPQPLVVDGRRLLPPKSVSRYEGIGRGMPA